MCKALDWFEFCADLSNPQRASPSARMERDRKYIASVSIRHDGAQLSFMTAIQTSATA